MSDLLNEVDKLALSELHDMLDCVQSDLSVNVEELESIQPHGTLGENLKELLIEYVKIRNNVAADALQLNPGWACKDNCGISWSQMKPVWDDVKGIWRMFGQFIFLKQSITDPWSESYPNGGPECCMEVK